MGIKMGVASELRVVFFLFLHSFYPTSRGIFMFTGMHGSNHVFAWREVFGSFCLVLDHEQNAQEASPTSNTPYPKIRDNWIQVAPYVDETCLGFCLAYPAMDKMLQTQDGSLCTHEVV